MRLDDHKRLDMKGGYFAVTLVGYCIGLTICEVGELDLLSGYCVGWTIWKVGEVELLSWNGRSLFPEEMHRLVLKQRFTDHWDLYFDHEDGKRTCKG